MQRKNNQISLQESRFLYSVEKALVNIRLLVWCSDFLAVHSTAGRRVEACHHIFISSIDAGVMWVVGGSEAATRQAPPALLSTPPTPAHTHDIVGFSRKSLRTLKTCKHFNSKYFRIISTTDAGMHAVFLYVEPCKSESWLNTVRYEIFSFC